MSDDNPETGIPAYIRSLIEPYRVVMDLKPGVASKTVEPTFIPPHCRPSDKQLQAMGRVTQGNEFRLTDLNGGGCRWRFWMCSEDLDPQRLCDPAPKCHYSVQEMLLGARWGASDGERPNQIR